MKGLVLAIGLWGSVACGLHHLDLDLQQKHFAGYDVIRVTPDNEGELAVLRTLSQNEDYQIDFWKQPTAVNQAVDMMVPPDKMPLVNRLLEDHAIQKTTLMQDVERYIQKEKLEMSTPSFLTGRDSNAFFTSYRSLQEIHNFVDELGEKNENITSVFSIGKSSDNNDLKAIKIGSKTLSKTSKPAIWIDGGIHGREWISPATVSYIASRLVEDYGRDEEVTNLVDFYDWYILPVINPDGYNHTHSTNRMWRKSVRVSERTAWGCRGVDLNRNWGFHWREGGSSRNPCSDTYAGTHAFSEPETKAASEFVYKRRESFKAFLAVHSYSQLWLTPWGWTSDLPKDYDQMVVVAQEGAEALSKPYGTRFKIGSSTNLLYVATGGADDWAYGVAGIKYSYTLELRDTGRHGFMLPSEQILPTGIETFEGVKAMAKAIKREL